MPAPPIKHLDVKNLDGYDQGVRQVQRFDEVDQLVQAWARERGDLDLTPVEVFSRITRVAKLLDQARKRAFSAHDLEGWEFDVLAALRRSGTPYLLSPGRLTKETLVTSGTMTNRIDRLATRGFVRRQPDPDDRRGVLVALTDSGRQRVDDAFEELLEQERALLGLLSAEDRRSLAGLLRSLMEPSAE